MHLFADLFGTLKKEREREKKKYIKIQNNTNRFILKKRSNQFKFKIKSK